MDKIQTPASFWRRTLTTLGDLLIFLSFAFLISSLYLLLSKKIFTSFVGEYVLFEGAVISIAMIVAILYLFVPKFLDGKTLFSYITRVKIVSTRNAKLKFREVISRQKLLAIF